MKAIRGAIGAVESGSDSFLPPTDAKAFLGVALQMLAGARVLAKVTPVHAVPLSLLCGQASETALKAMLAQRGVDAATLKKASHKVDHLWRQAAANGFALDASPPEWLCQLKHVYVDPAGLRYPLGRHGTILPDHVKMLRGVEDLCEMAREIVRSAGNESLDP